jgi:hypothetical protein
MKDDDSEMTPEERQSLSGQATARFFEAMKALDTTFATRLGEEPSTDDRIKSMAEMTTFLMNEVNALWAQIEALRRRLGDEAPF